MTQTIDHWNVAYEAYNAGRADDALSAARAGLDVDANDYRCLEIVGAVLASKGDLTGAIEAFVREAALLPDHASAQFHAGFTYYRANRAIEGIPYLRRAVVLAPQDGNARLILGVALPYAGRAVDLAEACDNLLEATRLMPMSADAFMQYGRILSYSSRESEAEAALRRSLELHEPNAIGHQLLGQALLELDRIDEALVQLDRALALNPNLSEARVDRDRIAERSKSRSNRKLARYPRSNKDFADVEKLIDDSLLATFKDVKPSLSTTTKVFTLGSCFAGNIAKTLERFGVPTKHVPYPDDINNTFANRYLLDWVREGTTPATEPYAKAFGESERAEIATSIAQSRMIIISLGVAPCFFDRATGEFALTFGASFQAALQSERYVFRTTTVAENVANVRSMIDSLRTLAPDSQIVLTVSPVPLKATFEFASAVTADCISKSTLRVAAHEIMQLGIPEVYYWPSFEVVRWFGGHFDYPVFGTDDDSPFHVSQALVNEIIFSFLKVFGKAEVVASARAALREPQTAQS